MNEEFFHIIEAAVQVIGLAVIIFGGGKYIGQNNAIIKQLSNDSIEARKDLNNHNDEIVDLKVGVAEIKTTVMNKYKS